MDINAFYYVKGIFVKKIVEKLHIKRRNITGYNKKVNNLPTYKENLSLSDVRFFIKLAVFLNIVFIIVQIYEFGDIYSTNFHIFILFCNIVWFLIIMLFVLKPNIYTVTEEEQEKMAKNIAAEFEITFEMAWMILTECKWDLFKAFVHLNLKKQAV